MNRAVPAGCICLVFLAALAQAVEMRELRGRVVDDKGQPVSGADVTHYWIANGPFWDKDGKQIDLTDRATFDEFFGPRRLGQMEPGVREVAKTDSDGQFTIEIAEPYHTLWAMDGPRLRGGLGEVSKADPAAPIEIRLGPLVRVKGTFEGPEKGARPARTHIYLHAPYDPTRPLDISRIVLCSSSEARFLMSLPQGRYTIEAYTGDLDARLSGKQFEVTGVEPEMDLGVLFLPPDNSVITKLKQSKAKGTLGDYKKHYGRKPPAWHVTAARGASSEVQISDFKGKWVVLDFWSLNCTPCLKHTIPKLMAFYEEHAGQRDRFEILSICLDPDGELKSMADLDRALEPIIKHVWGGKTMPFPILLDSTFATWESFGLQGVNTMLLVDPQGNLVEGNLDVLAQKLKE